MGIADKTNVKLRQEKATPLAQAEVDGNFQEIRNVIDDVVQVDTDLGTYVLANDQRVTNVETDLDTKVKVFDTVTLMKAASLSSGDLVTTKGYHEAGDGGQARYLVQTAIEFGSTPDEYGSHTLANGNVAVLQVEGAVNVKQFGAGNNNAVALMKADEFAHDKHIPITGTGFFVLSEPILLRNYFIDFRALEFQIEPNFGHDVAITYQALENNLEAKSFVSISIKGNREQQNTPVTAFKVVNTPNGHSEIEVIGADCNTLCHVTNNTERNVYRIYAHFCDIAVLDGDPTVSGSPDTNLFYINGGRCLQFYKKISSTTSHVVFNVQSQEETNLANDKAAIEIRRGRATTLSGELRGMVSKAMLILDEQLASSHFVQFSGLTFQGGGASGEPIIEVVNYNRILGRVIFNAPNSRAMDIKECGFVNLDTYVFNSDYVGSYIKLGNFSEGKSVSGSIEIDTVGSVAGAYLVEIDHAGGLDIKQEGSNVPIKINSTVNNDTLTISINRGYIINQIPIENPGNVRTDIGVRGLFTSSAILGYQHPIRGMKAYSLNTNSLCFYNGSTWQAPTTTTLT